ncbi:hypothetical protein M6B38_275690 [Iris pallida]|uniref:Uncharacterized protein n=1 Tax=Iris pallida TaxID=29817 RepID=A0AAX6I6R7_IRIPA|nr:hypothetical protein M6B38_275690 [Iris pallida]
MKFLSVSRRAIALESSPIQDIMYRYRLLKHLHVVSLMSYYVIFRDERERKRAE